MLSEPATPLRFKKLLLTGVAGNLGRELRPRLRRYCDTLRVSHYKPFGEPDAGEEAVVADLADKEAVSRMVEGVDAIVHMGGVSTEQAWERILNGNIIGIYNLYEAVLEHGVSRVIFASSNHVTGFYRQDQVVNTRDPVRPDSYYGLSKAFGENVAQLYWDRHGIETVSIRIGSSFPEPKDRRMLATWMSYDDLERLVVAGLTAPRVGHSIIYGMSDNSTTWWDNVYAKHIGYRPLDSSDQFRAATEARQPVLDPEDPAVVFQGGVFVRRREDD